MAYKIKISKAGYNALTETDPNNLVFSSDYNTLKYWKAGSVDVEGSVAYYDSYTDFFGTFYRFRKEVTVAHNLGFKPFFVAFVNRFPGTTSEYHMVPGQFFDFLAYVTANVYADSTYLYFVVEWNGTVSPSTLPTYTFKYKIFRNNTGL